MKYRLFLSDFDGTLVRNDGTISQKNKQAISHYIQSGGTFALCTGRGLPSILPRVRELGLTQGLVVAFQGANVYDLATGKLLRNGTFTQEGALLAIRAMEKRGLHIHVYTVNELYCNMDDEGLAYYEKICGVKAIICENLSEMVERERLPVVKVLAMVNPQDRFALCDGLSQELGEEYYVTCSSEFLVEAMPKGHNKGEALCYLANYFHIPIERTAAIGDQLNDLPMLERAGGKFAVANAEEALKEIATVVPSNEEDGVAEAILTYAMED